MLTIPKPNDELALMTTWPLLDQFPNHILVFALRFWRFVYWITLFWSSALWSLLTKSRLV